jgi:hypothetical protein
LHPFLNLSAEIIMSKTLLALMLSLSVSGLYAQGTTGSDAVSKTRAEVKAEERASGALGTKQNEYANPPTTKGSATSRAEVKAEERASGSMSNKQTEYTDSPSGKRRKVDANEGSPASDPFAQSRNEKAQAKSEYKQDKSHGRDEYRQAKKESAAKLKSTHQRSETEKNLEVPK